VEWIEVARHVMWHTKKEGDISIACMGEGHLQNTIALLFRQINEIKQIMGDPIVAGTGWAERIVYAQQQKQMYITIMKAELEFRRQYGWPEQSNAKSD